ncbi:hypothetical protein PanWU01x14_080520, partial [Parasponia andersonii]
MKESFKIAAKVEFHKLIFSVESECATCPTAIVLKNCIETPSFLLLLPGGPPEATHGNCSSEPPPSTVTGRRRQTSAEYCCRESPPVTGEIVVERFRHRNGFSPAVPPFDVRSLCHYHRWIRLDSSFDFRPLSASNSAP